MNWLKYPIFAELSSTLWIVGLLVLLFIKHKNKNWISAILFLIGLGGLICFTVNLWISLERPPFKTIAETRLWYALFISAIGLIIYYRWKLLWMLVYSLSLAILFVFINYFNPDTFDKTLNPALQSPWLIPHVVVYMIGYAFLAVSFLTGLKGLVMYHRKFDVSDTLKMADKLVFIGFAFVTLGIIFGILWAYQVWGVFLTGDPKEIWAFLTWLVYLLYILLRVNKKMAIKSTLLILALAFVVLLITWFGINYLPSAQESIHVYSN